MAYKIKRVLALLFISFTFLVGLLGIYRGTLKLSMLKTITGKVVDKKIEYSTSYSSGSHYSLVFQLEDRKDKIAINLGTRNQAENDSTFYFIETGKIYRFYLDPTVPTTNEGNWGIRKIDYNQVEIYRASNKLNLYGGIILSILSLAGIITIIKFKKKASGN